MNGEDNNRKILCDIARCAFGVVNRLLERDQLLASDLRSSTTGSRQIYREECITVEMATELRERFPENVQITLFTPLEEKRTGADWYWRFEKAGAAIHARVQAKRVQRTTFGQADDEGYVDIDAPQLADLVNATNEAATKIPGLQAWLATFARFDATPPCGEADLRKCRRHTHQVECASYSPSLWVAQAKDFRSNNGRNSVKKIVENSIRLDCILPCIDGSNAVPGPANKGFNLQSGLRTYEECIAIIDDDSELLMQFEGALRIAV